MDSVLSHEFDNVKAQKAKALRRYEMSRKLKTLAHALELLVALILLSWYSFGLSAAAGDFLRRLAILLAKPLVVFLICNGIIVIILFLAGKNDNRQEASHFYEEYLSVRRASGGGSPGTMAGPDETHTDEQVAPYETTPAHEKIITEVPLAMPGSDPLTSTVEPAVQKDADEEHARPGAIHPARPAAAVAAEEKRYRRTRSELTGEEKPRGELGRSTTDNGRPKTSSAAVDDLSDEEFNRKVEKYIAKTKWLLRKETMAEDAPPSFHSVAVN